MIALDDRALLKISGDGAEDFLQNLITTDVAKVIEGGCHAGALLTPQGKIQFEFLISGAACDFIIETGSDQIEALLKRLMMYRLRLPLTIEKSELKVFASQQALSGLRDHRFQSEIYRLYSAENLETDGMDWLTKTMIQEGVAQIGIDFELGDVFPHDINFDQIGGMSFSKGCYVGQEVISRMHHKGGVRKRLMVLSVEDDLGASDAETVTVDGKSIGSVGTRSGQYGLAICRIDKANKAITESKDILLGNNVVSISVPKGAQFTFPLESEVH